MLNNKKGMTLIEIVVVITVVVIVFAVVNTLVLSSTRFYRGEETNVENQTALRLVALDFEGSMRKYVQDVNAHISKTESGNLVCYALGDTVISNYCHDTVEKTVSKNGLVLGENIESFDVVIDTTNHIVDLYLQSMEDSRRNFVSFDLKIYVRVERVG